ncbi:Protein CBG16725 [Caenorhabditis briggsae]|uniref:Protein CBG16725 n=1 Tax=Caenorhabditis briggsae TaxID=6238 RepID=A8XPP5_CAEBR|nr:Protein CBG16725 [Caenorhabditis briggsae]CAP34621.2 Protein CBG16725 [Caenorhabditis briggsae]
MTVFNIAVVIIIRGLLDTEDEFDNPIIQGEMREELTAFLGIFTMTFFFCCCGCFCCGCACCRWCFFQFPYGVAKLWQEAAPNEDHVANARGILSKKMNEKQSDRCAYENTGYQDIIEMERVPQPPRLILPPAASGRLRSQSIDVSAIV